MQTWEDIAPSDMDIKNESWLIWKEHDLLWENIWAGALSWQIEGKNPKLSHPSSDVCHSYTTLSLGAKNIFKATAQLKTFCVYICLVC